MPQKIPTNLKRIDDLSGGRLRLEVLPAGAIVSSIQVVDAVHSGIMDAGYTEGAFAAGKHIALSLMTSVPFGFTPRDHIAFRRRPEVKAIFDSLFGHVLKLNVVAGVKV